MAYLLIRDIDPQLRREIEKRARANRRTVAEEAHALLRQEIRHQVAQSKVSHPKGLRAQPGNRKLGTEMMNLLPPEYRGDYEFEIRGEIRDPPSFD
jgi:hypothetical protein